MSEIRDILESYNLNWIMDREEYEALVRRLEEREAIMFFPSVTEANRIDAPLTD